MTTKAGEPALILWRDVGEANVCDGRVLTSTHLDRARLLSFACLDLLVARSKTIPKNLSTAYSSESGGGLEIVRGVGTYLIDADGRVYLDCVNNVTHVGHANPLVNRAIQQQQECVNTNTRYLSRGLTDYTRRLLALFPTPIDQGRCFMVASGSEANDLAMRLCRAYSYSTREQQPTSSASSVLASSSPTSASSTTPSRMEMFVCLAYGYHGATNSVIEISPYKYRSKGGRGRAPHIIEVNVSADGFDEAMQIRELLKLQETIQAALSAGHVICGFFHESVLSCAGQIFLPPKFIQGIYTIVRKAGGLCVADEVQTGFGRLGSCWWAFETLDVMPDIVTMGKSIGNGYPMAAVVCTEEVAKRFHHGMEYFNSCAGTNTATAVGLAVLDCIEQQKLLSHASRVGQHFYQQLCSLALQFPLIYDVRGEGLFLGIEFQSNPTHPPNINHNKYGIVSSSASHRPPIKIQLAQLPNYSLVTCPCASSTSAASTSMSALQPSSAFSSATSAGSSPTTTPQPSCPLDDGDLCSWLCAALVHCRPIGILGSTDGPRHNVIKLKPPMVFTEQDVDYFCAGLKLCLLQLHQLHPCLFQRVSSDGPLQRSKL